VRASEFPLVWVEVIGQDGDSLRRFYGQVLGWTFQAEPRRRTSVAQVGEGSPGLRGRVGEVGPGQPSWLTFYAEVPDLDAALSRARALGSRVLLAPTRLAEATIAVVSDPAGHPVGLLSRPAAAAGGDPAR
jgi:predicted enzyme related to lactoylglutathione lyase